MKKTLILFIGFFLGATAFSQKNPYAIFGHENKEHYETTTRDFFSVSIKDTTSNIKKLAFNFEDGYVLFLGVNDTIFKKVVIKPEQILRFLSADPAEKEYPSLSPYVFVANTPINAIDPDGQRILFVNGYYQDNSIGRNIVGADKGGMAYWQYNSERSTNSSSFIRGAQSFLKDYHGNQFIDGSGSWTSTASLRYNAG
ncbi:MAG: hypothetical protein LAT68_17210 [Cyclobacteriaceae bacterium]|nr:hypothetical protein [Cyclobacteriaceae bacterium]MCH8518038.1 hypothetical protein [Cyclobacteriaceae bacterium]